MVWRGFGEGGLGVGVAIVLWERGWGSILFGGFGLEESPRMRRMACAVVDVMGIEV